MNRTALLIAGLAGAAFFLLYFFRKRVATLAQFVYTEARKQAFVRTIPSRTRVYAPVLLRVAQEEGLSPFLLAGFMERESASGVALSPPGPGGTGDGGHGRGLMQIDDRSHTTWINTNNWKDPYTNIKYGAKVLKQNLSYFSIKPPVGSKVVVSAGSYAANSGVPVGTYADPRPLAGGALWAAAVAAYNTGAGNAIKSIAAGKSPDTTTAKKNYSSDVLAKVGSWEQSFDTLVG